MLIVGDDERNISRCCGVWRALTPWEMVIWGYGIVAVSACNRTTLKIMVFVFEIMTFDTNFHLQKRKSILIRLGNRTQP